MSILHSIQLWLPSTRMRRYQAALATLLAPHAFEKLSGQERSKVDDELVEIYRPFGIYPWWRFRKDLSESSMAGDRAIAMARLGLSTGVNLLGWEQVLHPWHRMNPALLSLDFRLRHPCTERAKLDLLSYGVSPVRQA